MRSKTFRKKRVFLRKTAKKDVKSGGVRAIPFQLRAEAPAWQPESVRPVSPERPVSPRPASPERPASPRPVEVDDFTKLFALKMLKSQGSAQAKKRIENAVAIDCEMVGVGPLKYDDRGREYRESSLAHVVIVDFKGKKRLDTYVIPKEGINAVTDYRFEKSGITEEILRRLNSTHHTYEKVLSKVKAILKNKIIVGHQLSSDFKMIDFVPSGNNIVWDSAIIDMYRKDVPGWGRGARPLKNITKEFVGNNIQVPGRPHSPTEDALAALNLYRKFMGYDKLPLH